MLTKSLPQSRALALALTVAVSVVLSAGAQPVPTAPIAAQSAPQAAALAQALITPNYKDADLTQIVEAISQITGRNFIIDPRVKAQVTMLSSTPMTPDAFYEAFLSILQVHGFVAVPSGKLWKIIPDANSRQVPANDLPDSVSANSDELVTQVVQLKNANAAQLVPILRPLIPQNGHLAAYPATNMLIISDHANNVNRMVRILERIEQGGDDDIDVIRLEHATAGEITRVINQLAAGGQAEGGSSAKIIADDRTNSILLSGDKNQRLKLRALVAHLDTPLETGSGTHVRYLKYGDAEKIAGKLKEQLQATSTQGAAAAGGAGAADKSTSIWADPTTNALVITAPSKQMRQLMDIVDHLDIRRLEVQVEAIIVEITGSSNVDLGVNWFFDGSNKNQPAGGFISPVGTGGPSIATLAAAALNPTGVTPSAIPNGFTMGIGRLKQSGVNFGAILNALQGKANTNIISTPSIVTLDNQEATIKVATEVPFLTGSYSSSYGMAGNAAGGTGATGGTSGVVNPFQTIQRQEVGTILKITPQITDDGTVLLKIEQEVSNLIKSSIATVDVQTSKRVINTRVLANDGEIIVLGGLISDSVSSSAQAIPFLGSIPGLGNLFKTRSSTKEKTNLMVFLRPKILVDGAQMASETSAKYNYMRGLEMRRGRNVELQPGVPNPTMPDLRDLQPSTEPPTETPKARANRQTERSLESPPHLQTTPASPPRTVPDAPSAPATEGPGG
ncbi:MAG: type II secretion system secretin GspD [Pseudomonadota bacterium]